MYFSSLIGLLSQLGTFMIVFSILYFLSNFILKKILRKNDFLILKRIYISDLLSVSVSLLFIFNFVTINPSI